MARYGAHSLQTSFAPRSFFGSILPMVYLYSGDKSCILSTLGFVLKQAEKQNVASVKTFDSRDHLMSCAPKDSRNNSIFHPLMNLIGEVGTSALMDERNRRNILEIMHGENALLHILTELAKLFKELFEDT